MKLVVYLINLDGSDARLASAADQLDTAGIAYERVSAFDGRNVAPETFPQYDRSRAVGFYGRPMTGGEMGCYFSHLDCARRFLAADADLALVLEDDVRMDPDAGRALADLVRLIETGDLGRWDLINLCNAPKRFYSPIGEFAGMGKRYRLVRAHYFPVKTTAILWSRPGAERFVATEGRIFGPLDHFFRRWLSVSGRGLASIPALFTVTGAASDLDAEGPGGPARKRIPRTPVYFLREARRQSVNYLSALWHMLVYRLSRS